jgi:hypothetical protein
MPMPAEKQSSYETFDSAGGPIQQGQGETAHNDANPSDNGVEHGAVPEVPQVK